LSAFEAVRLRVAGDGLFLAYSIHKEVFISLLLVNSSAPRKNEFLKNLRLRAGTTIKARNKPRWRVGLLPN
jgi:hypothetical protein